MKDKIDKAGYGLCYICLGPGGEWPEGLLSCCQDCGLDYCEQCFMTDDHIMCTPEDQWKKNFLRSLEIYEKEAWLAIIS